jgi:hypothetical protein
MRLSHTWKAGEEVKLAEMQILSLHVDEALNSFKPELTGSLNATRYSQVLAKSGYLRIKRFCEAAMNVGFEYGWVDTCCIDKMSSSEFSEAINSMYRWYRQAKVCYVYLSGVA